MNIPHVVSMAAREAGISTYEARAALTAAAPAIQAAALRDAADAADDPSPDEMDFYKIDQAEIGNWLRARAEQLEGKTK